MLDFFFLFLVNSRHPWLTGTERTYFLRSCAKTAKRELINTIGQVKEKHKLVFKTREPRDIKGRLDNSLFFKQNFQNRPKWPLPYQNYGKNGSKLEKIFFVWIRCLSMWVVIDLYRMHYAIYSKFVSHNFLFRAIISPSLIRVITS